MEGRLVRDGSPEAVPMHRRELHRLDEQSFEAALIRQLGREVMALADDPSLQRRAEIAELLRMHDELHGYTDRDIEQARRELLDKAGGYRKQLFFEDGS